MNTIPQCESQRDELRELLARSQKGDARAFESLVRLLQPMVFQIALGFFRDHDDAMEVLQDTFLRVYRNLHKVDHAVGLRGWVFRIATNIAIDHYRARRKRSDRERKLTLIQNGITDRSHNPEERSEQAERVKRLQAAVDQLSTRERSVFVLKHINHLKMKEIAAILDISLGTVKSTHFRAVNHLRREVAAGGEA
ncbi:MAG: sigma-70 family RNA polymerase sigma factor [Candidatus Aminicenantes bacterium]|nr:sigma-70 family RNA polymerase sigma factor [Candidatus Aminicenantes bacterium]